MKIVTRSRLSVEFIIIILIIVCSPVVTFFIMKKYYPRHFNDYICKPYVDWKIERIKKQLVELNPGSNPDYFQYKHQKYTFKIKDVILDEKIHDISPLANIKITGGIIFYGMSISEISALKGQEITNLILTKTKVSDVTPLQNCRQLYHLDLDYTKVSDLTPLKNLPLGSLSLGNTQVSDLSPLVGMKTLEDLSIENTPASKKPIPEGIYGIIYIDNDDEPDYCGY